MKTKYGFVVLIDALGTKTDSIESSERYLKAVGQIEKAIKISHFIAYRAAETTDLKLFKNLKIRFFGDTLLLTFEIKSKLREHDYFKGLSYILSHFILEALELGILFRGSFSLGEYLEDGNIVLGPAVFDAAAWYDKLEMIGIIATPRTTMSLKSIFLQRDTTAISSWISGVFDEYPLKGGGQIELYAINWPAALEGDDRDPKRETEKSRFYRLMRNFSVPLGAESKLQNTEQFFLKLYRSQDWEERIGHQEEEMKKEGLSK
jgi:hypothetical protein